MSKLEFEFGPRREVDEDGRLMLILTFVIKNWWDCRHHPICPTCPTGETREWEADMYGRCEGIDCCGNGSIKVPVLGWNKSRIRSAMCGIADRFP
jgi:hypothetical protein